MTGSSIYTLPSVTAAGVVVVVVVVLTTAISTRIYRCTLYILKAIPNYVIFLFFFPIVLHVARYVIIPFQRSIGLILKLGK